MNLKPTLRVGVLAAAAALVVAAPIAANAEEITIHLRPDHVDRTADYFETGDCGAFGAGENDDLWVFVLPEAVHADGNFVWLEATFEDLDGVAQTLTATNISGSGDNKAYIVTPAGWTLKGASAGVNDPQGPGENFNVTHTCPGVPAPPDEETTPPDEETTPPDEETTPPDEETTPPDEETTPPDEETTPPAEETTPPADQTQPPKDQAGPPRESDSTEERGLPKTGLALPGVLLAALALVAAGLVTYFLARRRGGASGA